MEQIRSRVEKIVCDKGGARNGMGRPTFSQTPETDYLDGSKAVFFSKELTEGIEEKEQIDLKNLFEVFHSQIKEETHEFHGFFLECKRGVSAMEQNIARQIIYGNNFIPPTSDNKGWEYLAFGTFDGVYVGDAIKSSSPQELLDEVWKRQKAFSSELNGKYTFQEEYIYCYEDEDKEEAFWQMDEDDYPFTFFCHLQFQGNWEIIYIKESLLREINEKTNALAQVYTSYNNTDILLVVKAPNYAEGAGIISALHKGMNFSRNLNCNCKLRNSFSVFAMKMV